MLEVAVPSDLASLMPTGGLQFGDEFSGGTRHVCGTLPATGT